MNNQHNFSGGGFIPLGQILNLMQPQQPQQTSERSYLFPPVRVQFALEVLKHFSIKTSPKAAANDHVVEWADKVELTKSEANAEASACNVISEYLSGRLEENPWEEMSLGDEVEPESPKQLRMIEGRIINCPGCKGLGSQDQKGPCQFCRGSGKLMLSPLQKMDS